MGRIRSIHPDQWQSAAFVRLSPHARLLCLALRNEADDNGIFRWEPDDLKIRLMPTDDVDIRALLAELEEPFQAKIHIESYVVGGQRFAAIRNFHKFQSPRRPTYRHPLPENGELAGKVFHTPTARVPDTSGTPPVPVHHGEGEGEGKGEGKGNYLECMEPETDSAPAERVLTLFDVVKKPPSRGWTDGEKLWPFTEAHMIELHGTWGDRIDLVDSVKRAQQWCRDNSVKRKTYDGMRKFLGGWIGRDVDKGRGLPPISLEKTLGVKVVG